LIRDGRGGSERQRQTALDQLLRQYYTPVLRFFEKVLGVHGNDLEDLTQDFFTRFVEKDFLKNIVRESNFRGFLKVACRRHFINWLESRRAADRRIPLARAEDRIAELAAAPERMDAMIDDEVRTWMIEEAVARARRKLSGEGREIQMKVFEARTGLDGPPLDYKALAEKFRISVYDVGHCLSAGRKAVREALFEVASERSDDATEELGSLDLLQFLAKRPRRAD
jgi:RNA polymerase sigma factor (sigma-70 family)